MLTVKKLLPGARERRAFDAFFLDGREYPDVAPLLRLNRGNFFHWVYATEQKVGDALIRRGIFPLEVYFGGPHRPRVEVIKGRARAKLTGSWGASSAYMILAA